MEIYSLVIIKKKKRSLPSKKNISVENYLKIVFTQSKYIIYILTKFKIFF